MNAGDWTWLEVVKLASGLFIPLTVAGVGIYIHRITKQFEHVLWRSQKLIEKRIQVYDDLMPIFNDLLCYFSYVGNWKEIDPPEVIGLKRIVDKKIHVSAPLFGPEFYLACMDFQNTCFSSINGWGLNAQLRTHFHRRRDARPEDWNEDWEKCFSDRRSEPAVVRAAYARLVAVFSSELGVNRKPIATPNCADEK